MRHKAVLWDAEAPSQRIEIGANWTMTFDAVSRVFVRSTAVLALWGPSLLGVSAIVTTIIILTWTSVLIVLSMSRISKSAGSTSIVTHVFAYERSAIIHDYEMCRFREKVAQSTTLHVDDTWK